LLKIRNSRKGDDGLLDKLRRCCDSDGDLRRKETSETIGEVDRALKMFYLHMKMSG